MSGNGRKLRQATGKLGEIENKRMGMNEEKIAMNGTLRIRARESGARLTGRPPFFLPRFLLLNCLLLSFSLLARPLQAQAPSPEQAQEQPQQHPQQAPVISINITRTIQAVNYRTKGSTHINFRGTALLPQGTGEAETSRERLRLKRNSRIYPRLLSLVRPT